jgi:hypothetical protein
MGTSLSGGWGGAGNHGYEDRLRERQIQGDLPIVITKTVEGKTAAKKEGEPGCERPAP